MAQGIAVVGANGSGKTTLGRRLAELLGYRHMDIEDYSFRESAVPYAAPRSREEVRAMLTADIDRYGSFVLSAVNGDMGEAINALYRCIVYIQVPPAVRLERLKQRSLARFGRRILKGGDLYEQEQRFFHFAAFRSMDATDRWTEGMACPVIAVDGTQPVEENARRLQAALAALPPHGSR